MNRIAAALPALCLAVVPAVQAEVTASSPTGFTSTHRQEVKATPAQAFDAIGQLPQWWNPAHSYSGKGTNLRLVLKAGDCFCEQWDGNSVEHARVIFVQRGAAVRLEGGLGPLQDLAVNGVLTLSTAAAEGKTFVRMVYRVSGAPDAGLEKLAPIVDKVIAEQFSRWAAFVDTPKP